MDFVPQLTRPDLKSFNDMIYKPNIVLTPKECTTHVNDYVLSKQKQKRQENASLRSALDRKSQSDTNQE